MSNAQDIIEAIRQDASVEPVGANGRVYSVGHGRQLVDLEEYADKFAEQPRRKKGTYQVHDAASFLAYLRTHGTPEGSEVWADFPHASITGVLNAHTVGGPEWEDHRLVYRVLPTDAWKAWLALDGKLLGQAQFAEHLEDRSIDIIDPSAADMLEIAQTFHATSNVDFQSATRLADGQRQLRYREQIDASAGRAGDMTIPERFILALKPFEGAAGYRVTARLRYRISEGTLRIGYRLERPEDVLREAFTGVVDEISGATEVPVLRGSR